MPWQRSVRDLSLLYALRTAFLLEPTLKNTSQGGPSDFFVLAFLACTAYNICMQYTIRNVPDHLDEALRRAAREQGKSLNEMAIEALARGAGVTGERSRQRDLNDIAGTWRKDPAFDRALEAQDKIDEEMWK